MKLSETADWRMLLAWQLRSILARNRQSLYRDVSYFELAPWPWHAALRIGLGPPLVDVSPDVSLHVPAAQIVVRVLPEATPQTVALAARRFWNWLHPEFTEELRRLEKPPKPVRIPAEVRLQLAKGYVVSPAVRPPDIIPARENPGWSVTKLNPSVNRFGTQLLILAPHVSEDAANVAAENEIWFWDAAGNYRIQLPGVSMERVGNPNPTPRTPELDALMTGVSGQIVRTLLCRGPHGWTLLELRDAANASLGLVSKVTQKLLERNLCVRDGGKLAVKEPRKLTRALLDVASRSGSNVRCSDCEPVADLRSIIEHCQANRIRYGISSAVDDELETNWATVHIEADVDSLLSSLAISPCRDGRIIVKRLDDRAVMWGAREEQVTDIGVAKVVSRLQRMLDLAGSCPDDLMLAITKADAWVDALWPDGT